VGGTLNDVVWTHRPALRRPVLVAAFGGWNDAGDAASAAVEFIRSRFEPKEIARIELEDYLDFTETRPTARLVDSHTREIDWPATTIAAAEVPGADNDLVVVQGPEPALRWRRYCETVITIAQELDVRRVVTLGSLLADVPHSRPVHVTGIGSDTALLDRLGFAPTSYEGPTGITGVLNYESGLAGLPSVSLWASVPHYVAAAPNPKVALALVRAFEGAAGLAVDATDLEQAAEDYERQVNAAVASDPEVKAFVERLESAMDEVTEDDGIEPNIPSADMIASDFQRFLRQRRG
jgi:proteasome assembly chaperone (PAC2) family protein